MSMSNFPAVTADAVAAMQHAPAAPLAPAAPDLVGFLLLQLSTQLEPALNALVGKRLAKFAWKSRAASGASGFVEVALAGVRRGGRAGTPRFMLDFKLSPKGGADFVTEVTIYLHRDTRQGSLLVRCSLGGNTRAWECAVWAGDELEAHGGFSRPNNLEAVEHFGTVWFGTQQDAAKHGVSTGVERVGQPIVHPLLEKFWPRFSLTSKKREWALARPPSMTVGENVEVNAEEWAASVLVLSLWSMLIRTLTDPEEKIAFDGLTSPELAGLPALDAYWPRRSVDLSAAEVQTTLQKEGLILPWHVVEAACAALNAGKHVIFTGPPGCGKSKLSGVLASMATGREALMVTASPAWTSGDLVGRYFPRRDGNGLEFKPGFFLKAIDEGNRWLVIDEFNRANIDECFGELFSVLADDTVELPFEEEMTEGAADTGAPKFGPVRILPARRSGRAGEATANANNVDYAVGPAFRLIGTMNDADRSSLHQLSFALLRRFHIIRVEAPAAAAVENVIRGATKRATDDLMLEQIAYKLTRDGRRAVALELELVMPRLKDLFARDLASRGSRSYTDLVQERVVGLATVQDIVRFIAEGLRGPSQGKDAVRVSTDSLSDDLAEHAEGTCASFLAIGVALSVFPQLDALTAESRLAAVKHILSVFQGGRDKPLLMRRIEAADAGSECALKLALVDHLDPTDYDFDHDRHVSIAEFLVEELCQQYRGTEEANDFRRLLVEASSDA